MKKKEDSVTDILFAVANKILRPRLVCFGCYQNITPPFEPLPYMTQVMYYRPPKYKSGIMPDLYFGGR